MKNINKIADEFIIYCQDVKKMTDTTIVTYQANLNRFMKWYEEQGHTTFKDLNCDVIDRYSAFLNNKGLKNTTQFSLLSTVKQFIIYLSKQGYIKADFSSLISMPKTPQKVPKSLNIDEVQRLLNACNFTATNENSKLRNKLICSIFVNCGLRESELLHLKRKDISIYDCSIRILGKGNKERLVYFSNKTRDMLVTYSEIEQLQEESLLFPNKQGKVMSAVALRKIVDKALEYADLKSKGYTVHTLRHTSATLMLENGVDLRTIQEVLGHTNLNTTQIYLTVTDERKKAAAQKMQF